MKKRILSGILAMILLVSNLGIQSKATTAEEVSNVSANQLLQTETEATEIISNASQLMDALARGGAYTIQGEIDATRPESGMDEPLIVEKPVTFTGGSISLDYGGILLGADAVFNGTDLKFTSSAYLGIFANGHRLTLSNLTIHWIYEDPFSLVAGGVLNNPLFEATAGTKGSIILDNVTANNNKNQNISIYAGNVYNISPLEAGSTAQEIGEAGFTTPVQIKVGDLTSAQAILYGTGAAYTGSKPGDANASVNLYDKIFASTQCTTNKDVSFTVEYPEDILKVDGATGLIGDTYVGAVLTIAPRDSEQKTLSAGQLGGVILDTEKNEGQLVSVKLINDGVTCFYPNAQVTVPQNSILDISDMIYMMNIGSFHGGGKLVLSMDQILTIAGQVSGNTGVAVKKESADSYETGGAALAGFTYIEATNSSSDSFYLIPEEGSQLSFVFSEGAWTTTGSSQVVIEEKINQIRATVSLVEKEINEATSYDDLEVIWEEDAFYCQLGYVPLQLFYNDSQQESTRVLGEDNYYYFTQTIEEEEYRIEVGTSQITFTPSLPVGTHKFNFKVPAASMVSGEEKEISFTIEVEEKAGQEIVEKQQGIATLTMEDWIYGQEASIPRVVSETNTIENAVYCYTGTDQSGNIYGPTEERPELAGSYTVEVTLEENENYHQVKAEADFTIEQKRITISRAVIKDKSYDTTTRAEVEALSFLDEQSQEVVLETEDYEAEAEFESEEEGENQIVTVRVTLLNHNYDLINPIVETTGNIIGYPKDLWVKGIQDYDYTGEKIIQENLEVYHHSQKLSINKDYTIKYKNNVKAGTATLTITGKGNYTGSIVKNFTIHPLDFTKAILAEEELTLSYNKRVQKPVTTLSYELNGRVVKLKKGTDFFFEYPQTDPRGADYDEKAFKEVNENPGYGIRVIGKGNYQGEKTLSLKITEKTLLSKLSLTKIGNQKYSETVAVTGEAVPKVILKDQGVELKPKTEGKEEEAYDYTIEYKNNKKVGTATIIIKANENSAKYAGTRIVNYKITGTPIKTVTIQGFEAAKNWTGQEVTQQLTLLPKGSTGSDILKEGEDNDYILSYENNTRVGKATLMITGSGEYTGTIKKTFKITGTPISKVTVTGLPQESVEYAGQPVVLSGYQLMDEGGKVLTPVEENGQGDYTVSYKNNHKAGTATITFTGQNGFTGKLSKTFKIHACNIDSNKIKILLEESYPYTKGGSQPKPQIIYGSGEGEILLTEGTDYTLKYKNNKAPSLTLDKVPTVTIVGKGGFAGSLTKEFSIHGGDLSQVQVKISDIVYHKKANLCRPALVLEDTNGKKLTAGTDYSKEVTYRYKESCRVERLEEKQYIQYWKEAGAVVEKEDIIPLGTIITATITGINSYAGSEKTAEFSYVKGVLNKASVIVQPQSYTGQEIFLEKGDITVKLGKNLLSPDTDYQITDYKNNREKGVAKVTIQGINSYGGEKTVSFKIISKNMKYTLHFDKNGENVTGTMKTMVTGDGVKLLGNTFKRPGYLFKGWNTKADGSGTPYEDKEVFEIKTGMKTYGNKITLYAQWEMITSSITYHLAEGDISLLDPELFPTKYTPLDEIVLPWLPNQQGKEFMGWFTDSNLSPSKALHKIPKGSGGDLVLYGGWKDSHIPEVEEPEEYLNPAIYGIIANDGRNDAEAIESALRQASANAEKGGINTVYLPAGVYNITPQDANKEGDPGISVMSNTNLIMDENAILLVESTGLEEYCVISVQYKENVTIQGGRIIGERYSHQGKAGESGFGIAVYGSTNVTISGVSVRDNWGDGIYLGTKRVFADYVGCNEITIENCEIYRNRRNNVAIVDANDVLIDGCLIYDAYGHAPQCGILNEPNKGSVDGDGVNRNITIRNTEVRTYQNKLHDSEHRSFMTHYNPNDPNYKTAENIQFIDCTLIGWFGNYSGYKLTIDNKTKSKMQGEYVNLREGK